MKRVMKLDIDLFNGVACSEDDYTRERAKYIARYEKLEYKPSFWGGTSEYIKRPDLGEAAWNERYPKGYADWFPRMGNTLTSFGQQKIIDKINEIVEHLPSPTKRKPS